MSVDTKHKEYYGGPSALKKRASELTKVVKVGIIAGTGTHPNSNGVTIAEIAAMNEFGTFEETLQAIPPRPFLRTALNKNRDKYINMQKSLLKNQLLGRISGQRFLDLMGSIAKRDIQDTIRNNDFAPNAESTIAAKKGKSKPLIDTGLLRQSINWVVTDA